MEPAFQAGPATVTGLHIRAPGRTRTHNLTVKSRELCHLRYRGVLKSIPDSNRLFCKAAVCDHYLTTQKSFEFATSPAL